MPQPFLTAVIPNAKVSWTPSDTAELPATTVRVRVAVGGTMVVQMWGNPSEVVQVPVASNEYLVGAFRRIMQTNTTAAGFLVDYISD